MWLERNTSTTPSLSIYHASDSVLINSSYSGKLIYCAYRTSVTTAWISVLQAVSSLVLKNHIFQVMILIQTLRCSEVYIDDMKVTSCHHTNGGSRNRCWKDVTELCWVCSFQVKIKLVFFLLFLTWGPEGCDNFYSSSEKAPFCTVFKYTTSKISKRVLGWAKHRIIIWLAILLPGIYTTELKIGAQVKTCTQICRAVLFTIVKGWKQYKWPSRDERINKLFGILCSLTRNEVLTNTKVSQTICQVKEARYDRPHIG